MTQPRSKQERLGSAVANVLLLASVVAALVVLPLGLVGAWNAMLSDQFVGAGLCLLAVASCAGVVLYVYAGR